MDFPYQEIINWVKGNLSPEIADDSPPSALQVDNIINYMNGQILKVKAIFENDIHNSRSSKEMEYVVHKTQRSLTDILNTLYSFSIDASKANLNQIYDTLYNILLSFFNNIQASYPNEFNKQQVLPTKSRIEAIAALQTNLKIFKSKSKNRVHDDFLHCFSNIVNNFSVGIDKDSITYYLVEYFQKIFADLQNLFRIETLDCSELFKEILYQYNFNHTSLASLITKSIANKLQNCLSIHEKRLILIEEQRIINKRCTMHNYYLVREDRSLKDEVSFWISSENKYLKKYSSLHLPLSDVKRKIKPDVTSTKKLIKHTVPQLACWIHLILEFKLMPGIDRGQLVKMFVENLKTDATEDISENYLSNESFMPSATGLRKTKDQLLDFLNYINKIKSKSR